MRKYVSVLLIPLIFLSIFCGCNAVSPPVEVSTPAINQTSQPFFELTGTWEPTGILYDNTYYEFETVPSLADMYDTNHLIVDQNGNFLYINNTFFHEGSIDYLSDIDSYLFKNTSSYHYEYTDGKVETIMSTSDEFNLYVGVYDPEVGLLFGDCKMNNEQFVLNDILLLCQKTSNDGDFESNIPAYSPTVTTPNKPVTVPFTNKYGTATTKCVMNGCNNYIASSGDTNCCTKHSNNCLNCNCYIDGDAMYCMTCLSGSKTTTPYSTPKPTQKPNSSTSTRKCQYKDYYGNVCGAKCTDYKNLCNKHFNELYSTYQSLTGN